MERMELEGIVGQATHAGKREILVEEERAVSDADTDWTAELDLSEPEYGADFHGKTIPLWSKARL